ncbi:ABC transporter ATP-binding protein [Pedosphaera parvula]|uniref:ABC transporter related-protein n=1 Tax=Pedosphaera parvula (strain Ellin514) TaxID=320771 RepID=B9XRR1_PEDPL|nr:ABC transporter ATP-binding protein [Pedosphaera parvula]EEF57476.1 ABC transporter related-protein [Pedosphaera parvula Ellin514]
MASATTAAVELRELTKQFNGCVANAGVNLRVEPGTIHGVIGENGAGKSTSMKMLYGVYRPDTGAIFVHGKKCDWSSPSAAIAAGIGMVHQHFMLAAPYSTLDNILLGAEPRRWGRIDRKAARTRLETLANQYNLPVDWDCPVEQLPVGIQQRIEILKLLFRNANILILDEPTAVLTPQETNDLFSNLKRLRDEGKTILLITHKLKEVMSVTDRITVFRAGKVTGELATSGTTPQELANLMVGRKVVLNIAVTPASPRAESAIEIKGLNLTGTMAGSRHKLSDVNFSVRRGEIVGIAGVEGNGQSELLQAILHPRDSRCRTSGAVTFLGQDVTAFQALKIRELGVALVPEDRHREGLLLEQSVRENFLLGLQRSPAFSRAGFLHSKKLETTVTQAIEEYDVRPRNLAIPAGSLSGGNQQKLIVAREFQRRPQVLIAAQPTRGVDVGAIEFIHQRIVRARDEGAGVLLVSSELEEIMALSDRILVMYEGRIVAEFERGQVSERELGLKMGGS